tara:strand:- start:1289 stop:1690 length:402 start_codon:yes stop_codon:yes gene_type:complete
MSKHKLDITKRQKQLLDELKKCDDELSGQELHRELHKGEMSMGLATVYRNLQTLVKQGLIRSRHLPTGEVLYTSVERDIHHLTCVNCGKTTRLNSCPVKAINLPKKINENFALLFHTLEYFGFCKDCFQSMDS